MNSDAHSTTSPQVFPGSAAVPRRAWVIVAGVSALVLLCWGFPAFWYTRTSSDQPAVWLSERTNVAGWRFTAVSIDKSAEASLAADVVFYGEYHRDKGGDVRLFCARRFTERSDEIGLFVHTPDRCWTEAGWKIEPVDPDFVDLDLGSVRLGIERRVFRHPTGARELVYFFGLVGGQTLPYRLDHNLGVGQRFLRKAEMDASGTRQRAVDKVLWRRVWESFVSRRQILGPKEFIRISTSVTGGSMEDGDALLRSALAELLEARAFSSGKN